MKKKILRWAIGLGILLISGIGLHLYNLDLWGPVIKASTPKVIAHRGASGQAPENTLAAIRKALELKVDLIEVDIHLSQDSVLVLMHDAELARCTNGEGWIGGHTLAQLKQLDAGSWFDSAFANEKIPTLEEVLQLVAGQATLLIELKWGPEGPYSGLERKLLALLTRHKAFPWVEVQSFESAYLHRLQALDSSLHLHKLILGELPLLPVFQDRELQWGKPYPFPGVRNINAWYYLLTRRFVNQVHALGQEVYVYTVNDPDQWEKCQSMGVDGIMTDFPERMMKWAKRR